MGHAAPGAHLTRATEPVRGYTTESVMHGQCITTPMITFPVAGHPAVT